MKIKKILFVIILFVISALFVNNPTHAILADARTINLEISNVEDIDNVKIYMLHPLEYIEHVYSTYSSDYINYLIEEDKSIEKTYNEMQNALTNKDYITAIKLDIDNEFFIFNLGFNGYEVILCDEYYEYQGKKYVKVEVPHDIFSKEYLEEYYKENTIQFESRIEEKYTDLSFKYLFVKGNEEKILILDNYEYSEMEYGVNCYDLTINLNYNDLITVNESDKFYSENENQYEIVPEEDPEIEPINPITPIEPIEPFPRIQTIKLGVTALFISMLFIIIILLIALSITLIILNKKKNPKQ